MATTDRFLASPDRCSYRPDQIAQLEYEFDPEATVAKYSARLLRGWRRFGSSMFRPRCQACAACRSLRVDVDRFRPDRSQRRVRKANEGIVELRIGPPAVTREKLALHRKYHQAQALAKGWPAHEDEDAASYTGSFVLNPFPTQEWTYWLGDILVGVGYVDVLPVGLSAIYFFHDPDHRHRSLGTWNILCLIDRARWLGLPHVYLGFYVEDCGSLAYKARFSPNEILDESGQWRPFRDRQSGSDASPRTRADQSVQKSG